MEEEDCGKDTDEEAQRCIMDEISDHANALTVIVTWKELSKSVSTSCSISFFIRKRKEC